MTRREKLDEIFKDVETNKKELINPLLDDIAFLEERMEELCVAAIPELEEAHKSQKDSYMHLLSGIEGQLKNILHPYGILKFHHYLKQF